MGSVVQAALVGMRGQLRGGKLVLPEEDGKACSPSYMLRCLDHVRRYATA